MAILPVEFGCGAGIKGYDRIVLLLTCAAVLLSFIGNARGTQPIPIKTILADGDIFDCVDIYKQPAFKHPLLKNHKILMKPAVPFIGEEEEEEQVEEAEEENGFLSHEYLGLKDGGCPSGTVPIQRLPNNSMNVTTRPTTIMPHFGLDQNEEDPFSHMWAIRYARNNTYYGASADVNVYGVHPMNWNDVSGAGVWLMNNNVLSPDKRNIIRAGWVVYPRAFNDFHTRLFVEWSSDSDRSGCINLQCPGFVQDMEENWWFAYHELKNGIGYWPAKLFEGTFKEASTIHYGGVVSCPKGKTCPPMGNGHNPTRGELGGMWDACFISRVRVADSNHTWDNLYALYQAPLVTLPRCYDLSYYFFFKNVGYKFTFGGPFCTPDHQG